MRPIKKIGIPTAVFLIGTTILITIWWVNGKELEDLWLYAFSLWLIAYGAYEVYKSLNKHTDEK